MTESELINIIKKLNKLLEKKHSKFENLIVTASLDKEKISQEEFINAMLKLDEKLNKSDLKGLFVKLDSAQLGDVQISDCKDRFDELTEEFIIPNKTASKASIKDIIDNDINELFDQFDKNKDGTMDKNELKNSF